MFIKRIDIDIEPNYDYGYDVYINGKKLMKLVDIGFWHYDLVALYDNDIIAHFAYSPKDSYFYCECIGYGGDIVYEKDLKGGISFRELKEGLNAVINYFLRKNYQPLIYEIFGGNDEI